MSLGPEFFQRGETVKAEIEELHQFFENWFNGRIDKNNFSRFENSVTEDFELVTPGAVLFNREKILSMVREGYATQNTRKIWTEDITTRPVGNTVLATYYELQELDGEFSKRLSSAVFIYDKDAVNFCRWNHVHETWVSA